MHHGAGRNFERRSLIDDVVFSVLFYWVFNCTKNNIHIFWRSFFFLSVLFRNFVITLIFSIFLKCKITLGKGCQRSHFEQIIRPRERRENKNWSRQAIIGCISRLYISAVYVIYLSINEKVCPITNCFNIKCMNVSCVCV